MQCFVQARSRSTNLVINRTQLGTDDASDNNQGSVAVLQWGCASRLMFSTKSGAAYARQVYSSWTAHYDECPVPCEIRIERLNGLPLSDRAWSIVMDYTASPDVAFRGFCTLMMFRPDRPQPFQLSAFQVNDLYAVCLPEHNAKSAIIANALIGLRQLIDDAQRANDWLEVVWLPISSKGPQGDSWFCGECTLLNDGFTDYCRMCNAMFKSAKVPPTAKAKDVLRAYTIFRWECQYCTLVNDETASACGACGAWQNSIPEPFTVIEPIPDVQLPVPAPSPVPDRKKCADVKDVKDVKVVCSTMTTTTTTTMTTTTTAKTVQCDVQSDDEHASAHLRQQQLRRIKSKTE